MASEIPVVRVFVACREVVVDAGTLNATLRNLVHAIIRLSGESFPCVREQMALYALMTNGRGKHGFAVELTVLDQGEERLVRQSAPRHVDLGQDPTIVQGLPILLRNVTFAHPGNTRFTCSVMASESAKRMSR